MKLRIPYLIALLVLLLPSLMLWLAPMRGASPDGIFHEQLFWGGVLLIAVPVSLVCWLAGLATNYKIAPPDPATADTPEAEAKRVARK